MQFILPFVDLEKHKAEEVLNSVFQAEKKPVGKIKIYDLMLYKGNPILNGVYLFFSPSGDCLYVGKNSAQKFVERIPWHFTVYEKAWMNHYLKYTRKYNRLDTLQEAVYTAQNDQLLLIPVDQTDLIKPLEKFFRLFAKPKYNSYTQKYCARHKYINLDSPILKVLKQL